jgi:hypothetical protein
MVASLQGASAQPTTQPETGYRPCEYVHTYSGRTHHGVVMNTDVPKPVNDFIAQEFKHGKATAQTFYYANKTPHLRVVLGSSGVPPTFLVKMASGVALAFNIPQSEQWCEIISQANIRASSVEVYTKGGQPTIGN